MSDPHNTTTEVYQELLDAAASFHDALHHDCYAEAGLQFADLLKAYDNYQQTVPHKRPTHDLPHA